MFGFGDAYTVVSKVKTWGWKGVRDAIYRAAERRIVGRRIARLVAQPPRHPVEKGITLVADFTGQLGLSKTMRDFARMLRAAGIPFQVYDTRLKPEIPDEVYRDYLTPPGEFDFHRYTHVVELYRSLLPPSVREKKARIVFHESTSGLLAAAPYLDTTDGIIGMSDFNVEYFRTELKRSKVFKIVYPFFKPSGTLTPRNEIRARHGIASDDFVAFFNFDFGSYHRKNPMGTIRAFGKAFRDTPDAKLVFKTMHARHALDRVEELQAIAREVGVGDRFVMINDYLSRAELNGLTNACDVYVSLHRAEGFGLGITEAMSLGRPAVVTDWSANTEFCNAGNSIPVPYRIVPIKPGEYLECTKEWADADVDAAAAALRKLYDDPALRADLGRKAKAFIEDHFSVANFKRSVEAFLEA